MKPVFDGLEETLKAMKVLDATVRTKTVKQGSRIAMNRVVARARQLAPKETGLLRKSIGLRQKSYRKGAVTSTVVGPRRGFASQVEVTLPDGSKVTRRRDPQFYSHLVEFGVQAHSLGKGSRIRKNIDKGGQRHPGVPAKPFLRPAWDSEADKLPNAIAEGIQQAVKKAGFDLGK